MKSLKGLYVGLLIVFLAGLLSCSNDTNSNATKTDINKSCVEPVIFNITETQTEGELLVTMSCKTTGAEIYYTTDNTIPTQYSIKYSEALIVKEDRDFAAIAISKDMENSPISYAKILINEKQIIINNYEPYVPEGFVKVKGATVNAAVSGSEVFINGRTIKIRTLWVCDHEITQKEYNIYCYNNIPQKSTGDDFPQATTWLDAVVYCNVRSMAEELTPVYAFEDETDPKLWRPVYYDEQKNKYQTDTNANWNNITIDSTGDGYRLPTEAEWEYIARGGSLLSTDKYSGTNTDNKLSDYAWYGGYEISGNNNTTHEVRGKKANSLGIYDMSGNLFEWCYDRYGTISIDTGANGPSTGDYRVIRGGDYYNNASACEVSFREKKEYTYWGAGFRVVRSCYN